VDLDLGEESLLSQNSERDISAAASQGQGASSSLESGENVGAERSNSKINTNDTTAENTQTTLESESVPQTSPPPFAAGNTGAVVGNTPLLDLSRLSKAENVKILAKMEFLNPTGSIKDRIALHMISRAESEGKIKPGVTTIVASTSGNTGCSVAMVCALKGYDYIVITSKKCSEEKRGSMRAFGGQVIIADDGLAADHPEHYVNLESTLCEQNENYFGIDQYENQHNPEAYYTSLGPEIWQQTRGRVTHFVAGGSTGGTVTGTGAYLKHVSDNQVQVLMPDPVGSVIFEHWAKHVPENELQASGYKVEGVGKDSIPGTLDLSFVDAMISVTDKQSIQMCQTLSSTAGALVGGSSGLNVYAAVELSKELGRQNPSREFTIVTVLPDSGLKYLSKIYNQTWCEENGFTDDEGDPQDEVNRSRCRDTAVPRASATEVDDDLAAEENKSPLFSREVANAFLKDAADILTEYAAAEDVHVVDDTSGGNSNSGNGSGSGGGGGGNSNSNNSNSNNEQEDNDETSPLLSSSSYNAPIVSTTALGGGANPAFPRAKLADPATPIPPVITLASPEEIDAAYRERASMSLSLLANGGGGSHTTDKLLEALKVTLDMSARTHHPLFLNQLYSGVDPIGLAGEWLTAATNTNVHTYEVAPVFTLIEREVLAKMASIWLADPDEVTSVAKPTTNRKSSFQKFLSSSEAADPMPTPSAENSLDDAVACAPPHDGLFVPGGSISNMYGMLLARHRADPEYVNRGAYGAPRLVAFVSDQAHYSFSKTAGVMGLGRDNVWSVESDASGAMIPDALERSIEKAVAEGATPFFVGATAATTVMGAFDPFVSIREICDRHSFTPAGASEDERVPIWMHVDAAWGGMYFMSPKLRKQTLRGAERADSLTWNPHKMMNMPLTCSVILTREPGSLQAMNASNAAYLFQPDKNFVEYDLGDRSIQCGRKADAFKLWLAWKAKGDLGWCLEVEHVNALGEGLERMIMDQQATSSVAGCSFEGRFLMATPRSCTNVCFWYIPPRLVGELDMHIVTVDSMGEPVSPVSLVGVPDELRSEIDGVAPKIKDRMQRMAGDGSALIGFQRNKGLPNFFRLVLPGGKGLSDEVLLRMLKRMDELGKDL